MKMIATLLFSSLFSIQLFAADGSSGCGAGWYIFKDNSLVSSALRGTTNALLLNTVGMTFGTSNCSRHNIVQKESEAVHFAEANYDTLMIEMSQGHGESLAGLATLVGCESAAFAPAAKANYERLFNNGVTDGATFYQNFKGVVLTSPEMAQSCGII